MQAEQFSDPSARAPVAAGHWPLAAGRSISLLPPSSGRLTVAAGCLWATLDGSLAQPAGDLFLAAGDSLLLAPGQRVVLESFGAPGQPAAAAFDWQPAPAAQAVRWSSAVAQPASELRQALASAALALGRLVAGVAAVLAGAAAQGLERRPSSVPPVLRCRDGAARA